MSGPKTATYSFRYDSTPTRIQDLESFTNEQEAWLKRNGGFIQRYLGEKALTEAQDALAYVDECITNQDPDAGFDAYGDAWSLFHELHDQAKEAKRRQQDAKRQAWLQEQQAAEGLVSQCDALWDDQDSRDFLYRWVRRETVDRLQASLDDLSNGKPFVIQKKARQWQRAWDEALSQAEQAAQENAKVLREHLPKLRAALESLQKLNARILPDAARFERERKELQHCVEEALRDEDGSRLQSCVRSLLRLRDVYAEKIRAAEFQKATETVRDALAACGYSVEFRRDKDGTVVLEASGFPMKLVNVQMKPTHKEMKLHVEDEHGSHCVQDIQSLQAELARHDMELSITDWGKGNPQGLCTSVEQNTVVRS
jgi:hypothetical protein